MIGAAKADCRFVRDIGDGVIIAECPDERHVPDLVTAINCHNSLVAALQFYVSICGNTAAMVTRESAREAYEMATKALAEARK